MKHIVMILFLVCSFSTVFAADYIKIRSYPSHPTPDKGVGRFLDLTIKPKSRHDLQFNEIFAEATKISQIKNHNLSIPDEAGIFLEISHKGKIISTHYSKRKGDENLELKQSWIKMFKLVHKISDAELHP